MKLINVNRSTHGMTIKIPIDGKVEIDKDGNVEVSDEAGKLLIANGGGDWTTKNLQKVKEAKQKLKKVEDEEEDETPPAAKKEVAATEAGELDVLLKALETMSVEEMLDVAKGAQIKNYQLFKNKPEVLRNYIKNKLSK